MRNTVTRCFNTDSDALAVLLTDAKKKNVKTARSLFQSVLRHWRYISPKRG